MKNSERIPESVENNYLLIGKKQNIYEIIKPINSIWLHYDFLLNKISSINLSVFKANF